MAAALHARKKEMEVEDKPRVIPPLA
ncbi:hypothetical protein A2U01_0085497, partial [Trifolium medium]|nr:hypothetical protein [Trifolium medium]